MPYDSQITRADLAGLIPEETFPEIFQGAIEQSSILGLMRRVPNMSAKQEKLPVLATLPEAWFTNGDTNLIQTSKAAWTDKYLYAESLGCVVPIPKAVLNDSKYNVFGQIRPLIVQAIGKRIDLAVGFGDNKPTLWPSDMLTAAVAAGNTVTFGGVGGDLYDDLLSEGGVISLVEADGYFPNGHLAALSMRAKLRGTRDQDGQPIFMRNMQDPTRFDLDGSPIIFPRNGGFDPAQALMLSGDFSQFVWCFREDIEFDIWTQASLHNPAGQLVYNLPQQQMIALAVTLRMAWQCPNPVNSVQGTEASRYPVGALLPAA